MNDPAGFPSGLGIETVEWFAEGGENLTVRVTGRWRRRRPTWIGRPLLVIEADGRRHRFPAMPEPPSVPGTAPGTWRMTFSIPASLVPHLGSAWLKLGVALIPLPVQAPPGELAVGERGQVEEREGPAPATPTEPGAPEEAAGTGGRGASEPADGRQRAAQEEAVPGKEEAAPAAAAEPRAPAAGPDQTTLAERRLRSAELALQATRAQLAHTEEVTGELGARIEELERELAEARREPERMNALLAERQRRTRAAEQRAYAERALREELEQELADREHEISRSAEVGEELTALRRRVRELEEDLERQRRRAAEAEQLAAAASVARRRAEQAMAALRAEQQRLRPGPPAPALASGTRSELELARGARAVSAPVTTRPPLAPEDVETLARERLIVSVREGAEARAAALQRELHNQRARIARAYAGIEAMRLQLEAIRLDRARELLGTPSGASVDPERLADALQRLRAQPPRDMRPESSGAAGAKANAAEAARPQAPTPRPGRKPWLERVFRALTDQDAATAGLLVLRLLPALRIIDRQPLVFDLALSEVGFLHVTVTEEDVQIEHASAPRGREHVAFEVVGDLPGFARLLVAGRLRRRVGRRVARVRGNRAAFSSLLRLVRGSFSLHELHSAGARLDSSLTFRVLSLMISPAWTRGHRFTVAHREPEAFSAGVYLHVHDGAQPVVTPALPVASVDTTIVTSGEALVDVLDGMHAAELIVEGDRQPLALLQQWVKLAESA